MLVHLRLSGQIDLVWRPCHISRKLPHHLHSGLHPQPHYSPKWDLYVVAYDTYSHRAARGDGRC